jgi:hypothetical protein
MTKEEMDAMVAAAKKKLESEPAPRLLCPLRFARLEPGCQQARCAWWVEGEHQRDCALTVIAKQVTAPLIY